MTDAGAVAFSLGLPKGWFRMPEPPQGGPVAGAGTPGAPPAPVAGWAGDWVDGVVAEVSGAQGFSAEETERLRASLATAAARAGAQHRPGRVRLVYLGHPEVPRVRAWAFLELYTGAGRTAESFAAALAAPPTGREGAAPGERGSAAPAPVRDREVAVTTLAGLPAVTVHDLVTAPPPAAAGTPAPARAVQHRFVATLFVPGDRILQLQISTPDLTAFADLPAVGRVMADSIVIGAPA